MLFVVAAGNSSANNDTTPAYPANFQAPNVISVAANDNPDALAYFSNYGATTVHLAAPGVNVLSTWPGGTYEIESGTSMATPHVSGAALLVLSACPMNTASLKQTLLANVFPVAQLSGLTITGGRLSVDNAIRACTGSPSAYSVTAGQTLAPPARRDDGELGCSGRSGWKRLGWTLSGWSAEHSIQLVSIHQRGCAAAPPH